MRCVALYSTKRWVDRQGRDEHTIRGDLFAGDLLPDNLRPDNLLPGDLVFGNRPW